MESTDRVGWAVPPPIPWPAGATSALCLTFDLDAETMWTSRDPENVKRPSVVSHGRFDVEMGLSIVLDFLDRNGISSTFFVPSLVAATHPDAVREILRRGHEVAHHGYDHSNWTGLSPEAERDAIKSAAEQLASVTGAAPVGYRAPLYGVNPSTWQTLEELGFTYSANLMDRIRPYIHQETRALVEIPVQWLLDDGVYFLVSYAPPNYRQPKLSSEVSEMWCAEVRANAAFGAVTTMTLHPQLIGRPARIGILQDMVDAANEVGGVWFPRMDELARHVRETAAGA